jgi:hypothetical protein
MARSTTQYDAATIKRCETILHNAGIATIEATALRAVTTAIKAQRTPIAPEAGFYADPSIAAGPVSRAVALEVASTPAPVAPTTPMQRRIDKRTPAKKAHMATRKPSIGQMDRVNDDHAEMGLRQYKSLRSFRQCFPTMLDASNYYYGV